jgi:carbon storage regulator CsrA
MLMLTRKEGESIVIGGRTIVKVCHIYHDGRIRLGIDAPEDVHIVRSEVLNKTDRLPHVHSNGDVAYGH